MQAEPSHCLHELSISKTVGHHFCPGLSARAEISGHSEKRMHLRPTPYFIFRGGGREGVLPHSKFSRLKQRIPVLLGNTCNCGPQRGPELWAGPFKCSLAC
jgi:hypothetical protein